MDYCIRKLLGLTEENFIGSIIYRVDGENPPTLF